MPSYDILDVESGVPFEELEQADLVVDREYLGGPAQSMTDDPTGRLLPVGMLGGFRIPRAKRERPLLVAVRTSGAGRAGRTSLTCRRERSPITATTGGRATTCASPLALGTSSCSEPLSLLTAGLQTDGSYLRISSSLRLVSAGTIGQRCPGPRCREPRRGRGSGRAAERHLKRGAPEPGRAGL